MLPPATVLLLLLRRPMLLLLLLIVEWPWLVEVLGTAARIGEDSGAGEEEEENEALLPPASRCRWCPTELDMLKPLLAGGTRIAPTKIGTAAAAIEEEEAD